VDVRLDLLERTCVRTLVILPPNNLFPPAPGSFTEPSQHSSSPTKATKELNALPTFVARHRTRWSETITSGSFTYLDQLTRAAILPFPFATLICEHRPGIVSNYGPRTILVQHRLTWTWAADESKGARRYCRSGTIFSSFSFVPVGAFDKPFPRTRCFSHFPTPPCLVAVLLDLDTDPCVNPAIFSGQISSH
jgi:hypothetical protein